MTTQNKLEQIEQIAIEITPHFTSSSTVREIAVYLLANYSDQLTHDEMASVVQLVKAKFGLKAQTSGSCIAWYKRDIKLKGNSEELKGVFRKYLNSLAKEEQAKILLEIALRHPNKLIESISDAELTAYLPVNDENPNAIPTEEQQEVARQKVAPLEEPKELVAAGKKLKKK